jgi:hypothetical protein
MHQRLQAEERRLRRAPKQHGRVREQLLCSCRCVSATDQMQFFTDAPLSPNMRTQMCKRIFATDPPDAALLNNTNNH